MKKVLIAVLALAAVACNKAEIVEQAPANAITFESVFVDNATKSVYDPSFNNTKMFSDFTLYGFVEGATLFNGTTVNKTIVNSELTSDWKYEGTQYWIADAKYNFSAVAPETDGNWTYKSATKEGTSLSFVNDGKHDVLYAQTETITGQSTGNTKVGFTFRHILSKVKFTFENTYNANNTELQVHEIKINNAYANADVDLTAATTTWSAWANNNLVLDFGNAATTAADAMQAFGYNTAIESYNELLLIPADYTSNKLNISFKYDIVVNGTVVRTFEMNPQVVVNLLPGHSYDFKATITPGEPIEFTVTSITDWTNENETAM